MQIPKALFWLSLALSLSGGLCDGCRNLSDNNQSTPLDNLGHNPVHVHLGASKSHSVLSCCYPCRAGLLRGHALRQVPLAGRGDQFGTRTALRSCALPIQGQPNAPKLQPFKQTRQVNATEECWRGWGNLLPETEPFQDWGGAYPAEVWTVSDVSVSRGCSLSLAERLLMTVTHVSLHCIMIDKRADQGNRPLKQAVIKT